MKKRISLVASLALAVCALLVAGALSACSSSSEPDPYVVFEYGSYFELNDTSSYDIYEIVYYHPTGNDSDFSIVEHENDYLSALVEEMHLKKSGGWTEELVEEVASEAYPNVDSMSFATKRITDEGDYYCVLVKFDDLDQQKNLKVMVENELLTLSDGEEVDNRFSAGYLMMNMRMKGSKQIEDEDVAGLGLHFQELD